MTTWRVWAAGAGLLSLLTACGNGPGPGGAPAAGSTPSTGPTTASHVTTRTDIDVVGDGSTEHKIDLFLPTGQGDGPFPLVVWVHGGGWAAGDKSDIGRDGDVKMVQTKNLLLAHGYAVAAPNYHLLPDTRFPQPMQDVAAAMRYLKAHAAELGVDGTRFALMGDSAGAHLAAMTAFTPDKVDLQGTLGQTGVDPRVKAFVGYYGIYDLTARTADQKQLCGGGKPGAKSSHGRLVGVDPDSPEGRPAAQVASPVTYATSTSPATLLISGRRDCTAPYPQAERFAQAITAAGGTAEVHLIDRPHADARFWVDPQIHDTLVGFLDSHVKN